MIRIHLLIAIVCAVSGCTTFDKLANSKLQKIEPPKLLKPLVRKIWIPPEIKAGGAEWTEGHYMYRIERETAWSR